MSIFVQPVLREVEGAVVGKGNNQHVFSDVSRQVEVGPRGVPRVSRETLARASESDREYCEWEKEAWRQCSAAGQSVSVEGH
ncbi:hypothetical protein ACLOJK_016069 [Asimina triloba]